MRICIWGAGNFGHSITRELVGIGLNIHAIYDNDAAKHGMRIFGIKVTSPPCKNTFDDNESIIIIAVFNEEFVKEITAQLESCCLKYGERFFNAKDFYFTSDGIKSTPISINLPDEYKLVSILDFRAISIIKASDNQSYYKYIIQENSAQYKKIIKRLKDANMLGNEFLATEISDELALTHPGALLLKHPRLKFIRHMNHWPPKMLKAFCIWHLDFFIKLDEAQLGIIDGHSYNATYCSGKFIYHDLGSIGLCKTGPMPMITFINYLINPLILISCGRHKMFYGELFGKFANNFECLEIKNYMTPDNRNKYENLMSDILVCFMREDVISACNLLKGYVISDVILPEIKSLWSEYQSLQIPIQWHNLNIKYKNAIQLIRKVAPRNMIDLAGNTGIMSLILSKEMEFCINADMDLGALDKLWEFMAANNEYEGSTILPLYHNVLTEFSHGAYSMLLHYKNTHISDFLNANLKCEIAVCLAIMHHLVFNWALSFEQLLKCFVSYTERYLLIEFIDVSDIHVQNGFADRVESFGWYTIENFETALLQHCTIVEKAPSSPENRTLYLCELI